MIDLVCEIDVSPALQASAERAAEAVLAHFGSPDKMISVVLTDDDTIRQLKKEHWGEDAATDVLSFPTWEVGDPFVPPHLGDVIVSLDTAQQQANARGHSLAREVALLISHGITHLHGHDHPHADGLGFEEGATGPEWEVFHEAWRVAESVLNVDE